MSEIGTDRLEPTAPVADRLGSPSQCEGGRRRARRPTAPPVPENPEPADDLEGPPHEVDSLA